MQLDRRMRAILQYHLRDIDDVLAPMCGEDFLEYQTRLKSMFSWDCEICHWEWWNGAATDHDHEFD